MHSLVVQLSILLEQKNWKVAVAESCTGGIVAAAITHRPGSSRIFDRGFVTYSNESKMECLGVSKTTLEEYGAVSAQTAIEMAKGTLRHSLADLSVSITGIAGPDGGSAEKPVGLVHFGYATKKGNAGSMKTAFQGSREEIRTQAAKFAIKQLITIIEREDA